MVRVPLTKAIGAGALLLFVWGAWTVYRSAPPPAELTRGVPVTGPGGSSLSATTDPAAVFQKAFWRRPAPDDKILHAERREWTSSADGVRKWQWFIAFQPGPQTSEWIASKPFGLAPAPSGFSLASLENRPAWFPGQVSDFRIQQDREGHLIWIQATDGSVLYATDSGFGFAVPAAKP